MTPHGRVLAAFFALCACTAAETDRVPVTFEAEVPDGTPTLYLSGSLAELGPWQADAAAMDGDGTLRTLTLDLAQGVEIEYKFTLGDWSREAMGADGRVPPNHVVTADAPKTVRHVIPGFKADPLDYLADPQGAEILGEITVWPDLPGDGLSETRHVVIWTPPGYDPAGPIRHPVVYMHDGQNLFDPRFANTGVDWGADEAALSVAAQTGGPVPIVVGTFSTARRWQEYAPQKIIERLPEADLAEWKARFAWPLDGDAYVAFLADDLKPRIDAAFRTDPRPQATFTAGSSMGGLISLYLLTERPDVFGGAAGLSIHWPIIGSEALLTDADDRWKTLIGNAYSDYLSEVAFDPQGKRIWLDHGDQTLDAYYPPFFAHMTGVLEAAGFRQGETFVARFYPGTAHTEADWRARLTEPFGFLLAPEGDAE